MQKRDALLGGISGAVGGLFAFVLALVAFASFSPSPQSWTAAFETNPANTDSIAQADDHMRQIKTEVRERVETEMDFGSGLGNIGTDTGRLLLGAARAFTGNALPTANGLISATCLAEADYNGNRGCDEGRLAVDLDGPDNVAANSDDRQAYVCRDTDSDGDCDSWVTLRADNSNPNIAASNVTSGTFADARIAQSNVTQHQAALALTAAQTTSGTFANARISQASVDQHATATPTASRIPLADGAGKLDAWITAVSASGLVPISKVTACTTNVDFTSGIDATYEQYLVQFVALPATDGARLRVVIDANGGASFDTAGTDYDYWTASDGPNLTGDTSASGSTSFMQLVAGAANNGVGSAGNEGSAGAFWIDSRLGDPTFRWDLEYVEEGDATIVRSLGAGHRRAAITVNALRFFWSAGNFAACRFQLYGLKIP